MSIPLNHLKKFPTVRREFNRVKRLGHSIPFIEVLERDFVQGGPKEHLRFTPTTMRATGRCDDCGGTLIIERDRRSDEADAITVCGSALTMECC